VLGELHARTEAASIVDAMRRGSLPTAAALHALAGAGTEAEVPVVLEFVADSNLLVRDEAASAAFALLDPNHPDGRAVEPLAAALRDGYQLRVSGVSATGNRIRIMVRDPSTGAVGTLTIPLRR